MGGGNARAGATRAALKGDPPARRRATYMRRQPPRGLAMMVTPPSGNSYPARDSFVASPRRYMRPWGPDREHAAVGAASREESGR